MTRLSNPIAVAQTQGSALNPLVSDCFSRVKWLCPPCHSPSHQNCHPGCLELAEPRTHTQTWFTYSPQNMVVYRRRCERCAIKMTISIIQLQSQTSMGDVMDTDPTGEWITCGFSIWFDLIYFIERFQGKIYRFSWLQLRFDLTTISSIVQNKLVAAVLENVVQKWTPTEGTAVFQPFGLLHL